MKNTIFQLDGGLPPPFLKRAFWITLALFLMTSLALALIDTGLRSPAAPRGIVSFEFCGFTGSCDQVLKQWGVRGQALALLSLGLDYLYLFLYPGLILMGLMLVSPLIPRGLSGVTLLVAWGCPLTSLADAIENYALVQVILTESGSSFGVLAAVFATIKFLALGLTLAWLLFLTVKYLLLPRLDA